MRAKARKKRLSLANGDTHIRLLPRKLSVR